MGAYHLRERYYSPQRGRFLTTDPFAGFTDLPRTLHRYLYVGADPVNYLDPSGLTETTEYHLNVVRPVINFHSKLCRIVDVVSDVTTVIGRLDDLIAVGALAFGETTLASLPLI